MILWQVSSLLRFCWTPTLPRCIVSGTLAIYRLVLIANSGFDPKTVFDAIYHPSCLKSLVGLFKERPETKNDAVEHAKVQERCIKGHLAAFFMNMVSSGQTAAQLHRENINRLDIQRSQLQSNSTCLWCLRRKPESPLSCKHAICNACVRIHGEEMPIVDCQYHIKACLLCQSGNCTVRLKPLSAGERILAVDGGGTRGVIPWNILVVIERMMDSELQIQDLFDIAFGTSVGES